MIPNDTRDKIVTFLEDALDSCYKQVLKHQENYRSHASKSSFKIKMITYKIQGIKSLFEETLEKKPYTLQKTTTECLKSV